MQGCIFEQLRRFEVRQSGVGTSRAALRMNDCRIHTWEAFGPGLGDRDDRKGRDMSIKAGKCPDRRVKGDVGRKQQTIPQRTFDARSQAF